MLIGHEIAHQMLRHHVNLGTHTRFVVQAVFSFMKNDCCSSDLSGKKHSGNGLRTVRAIDQIAPSAVFQLLGDFCGLTFSHDLAVRTNDAPICAQ